MQYITDLIPKSTPNSRRPGVSMNPTTLTIHSTGNLKSTAKNERAWLTNPANKRTASYNMVVDETTVVECLPTGLKGLFPNTTACEHGWHSGDGSGASSGNKTSLSIEICESGDREKTLKNAIELTARVLKEKGWGVDRLRQHYDWSGKNCPRILRDTGRWNWFVQEVNKRLTELKEIKKPVAVASVKKEVTKSVNKRVTVISTLLNIRKGVGTTYGVVGTYKYGDVVTVLEEKNGWCRTDKGWISVKFTKDYLKKGIVSASSLNIRKGVGTAYGIVGAYKKGDIITVLEEKNGWFRTDKGWISAKYVEVK